jgi:hypothetical protein
VGGKQDLVGVGLAALAVVNTLTALFAAIDPRGFYDAIGPFPPYNDHYVRDAAGAMVGALAVAQAIAVARHSWRVGVLGYTVLHFGFHAINHLVDIGDAEKDSAGVGDFVSLTLGTLLAGWLLARAIREERAA